MQHLILAMVHNASMEAWKTNSRWRSIVQESILPIVQYAQADKATTLMWWKPLNLPIRSLLSQAERETKPSSLPE
jgi:hypothetical protein